MALAELMEGVGCEELAYVRPKGVKKSEEAEGKEPYDRNVWLELLEWIGHKRGEAGQNPTNQALCDLVAHFVGAPSAEKAKPAATAAETKKPAKPKRGEQGTFTKVKTAGRTAAQQHLHAQGLLGTRAPPSSQVESTAEQEETEEEQDPTISYWSLLV